MPDKNNQILDADFLSVAENQMKSIRNRLKEIDDRIKDMQIERRVLTDKSRALESVLAAWVHKADKSHSTSPEEFEIKPSSSSTLYSRHSERRNSADLAEEILSERDGEHMHYKELAKEVLARGGNLPKGSPAFTLNAKMNQDSRFIRPFQRGFYALKKDHPNVNRSVGARSRSHRETSKTS